MKVCQSCGYENNDNAKFCAECGIQFLNTIFVCKSCGQTYEKMVKYCSECGTLIQTDENQRFSGFAEEILLTKELDFSHKAVDLGLSVKWADRNIGAPSPTEKGDYFAWGELKPKYYYGQDNYKWYSNGKYLRPGGLKSIVGSKFDIAQVAWGDKWRLPTTQQVEELIEKCTWEEEQSYFKVTGKNGSSIFLPKSGMYEGDSFVEDDDSPTSYWTASLVDNEEYENEFDHSLKYYDEDYASIFLTGTGLDAEFRYFGLNVRAVL